MTKPTNVAEVETDLQAGLPIRRHVLENGLTVICIYDDNAPIVSYQTWMKVGSSDEEQGKTGLAHLFEHLMFNETENLAPGEFDRRIEEVGGDSNAATWVDWTYFRTSVPSDTLLDIIEMEADRFKNIKLESQPFETERDVVKNERLLRVDDDVDGFSDEQLFALAFPEGHPYHAPTIGWMKDITNLSLLDAKRFHQKHYTPKAATIIVAGKFDEVPLLQKIRSEYQTTNSPALSGKAGTAPFPIQDFSIESVDKTIRKQVSSSRLYLAYATPPQAHEDWLALSLLTSVLTGGPSSLLYRELVVSTPIASSVDCSIMPFRGPGLFQISVNLLPDIEVEDALNIVKTCLADICKKPVPNAELEAAKAGQEMDFWLELDTLDGRAEAIGHFETTAGHYRELFSHAERIQLFTPEDVMRVRNKYFSDTGHITLRVVPENS